MLYTRTFTQVVAVTLTVACLAACNGHHAIPADAQIESAGMLAQHGQQRAAFDQLEDWARQGSACAQRELGIALAQSPAGAPRARSLFASAGDAGDARAATLLADAYYFGKLGLARDANQASQWYRTGAAHGDSTSALMLARMAKYGEAGAANPQAMVRWLTKASGLGNAQASFLLSNAYESGDGVAADPGQARRLLERAAEGDYPVAIQALAIALDGGDAHTPKDSARARHLIKEATDERLINRNRFR